MAKSNSTNDPVFTSCAVSNGRVMLGREARQGEDDLVVLGCIDTESARCLAAQLCKSADIAEPRPSDHLQNGALKKADQTVAESEDRYGYSDVRAALQKTSQAMAIMQVVSLAVAAQEDGSVTYEDNKLSRWGPAIDAACARVREVRDALQNKAAAPDAVDWWTSLTILEATGAALWHTAGPGHSDTELEEEQLRSVAEAAFGCLESMFGELCAVADDLSERAL